MAVADRRKSARGTVLDAVCCSVRDRSEGGAALDIGTQTGIPDQFTLIVPRGKIYPCTVIWRKPGRIGVSFI